MGVVSVPASAAPASAARLPPKAYYALTILTALNVINVWHRYLIANLSAVSVEDCDVCDDVPFVPLCYMDEETTTSEENCLACRYSYSTEFYNLKDGACIDTTQYSTLAGVGFTIPFAVATLFAGRLTDTLDRRFLHTGAILVWSIAAAAHGACEDYTCLMIAQVILGIGEAFNAPACYALITLYFPHSRRATANGIYSTGTYLGSALSSLCLATAALLGWRNTAFISGMAGVAAGAMLFFTVDHNPVMPPTATGYTELPDHDVDEFDFDIGYDKTNDEENYGSANTAAPPLPLPESIATAGHRSKVVSFADGVGVKSLGNGAAAAGAEDRRSVSLRSVLPPVGSGTPDERGVWSPSASSTSSASSRSSSSSPPQQYNDFSFDAPGGGGAGGGEREGGLPAGGALGSSGSSSSNISGEVVGVPSGSSRRRRRRTEGEVVGEPEDGRGGERPRERRKNSSSGSGRRRSGGRRRSSSSSDNKNRDDRATTRAAAEQQPEHNDDDDDEEEEESAGEQDSLNVFEAPGVAHRAERGGESSAGVGGGGYESGDGAVAAPYSSALQAVGAAAGDSNGSGWGWYEEDPAGSTTTSAAPSPEKRGVVVQGPAGEVLRKNDLCQALRMISSNRIVLVLFAASSARMIATWAMAGYMATYYHREFPSQVSLYSVLNAVAVSVGGMASSYGGGAISDRLRVRNEGVLGYLPALGSLLAILPVAVALFSTDFYLSISALFVTYLVGECWLGPGMACLQVELPKEIAGTSVAILLFLNSVICNVGTWFIGVMDGGVNGGLASIRKPIFAVLFMSYSMSFLLFGLLGVMVSNKHQRRLNVDIPSPPPPPPRQYGINGNGDDEKRYTCGNEDGGSSPTGGTSSGAQRRGPTMCEMVRRTFSKLGDDPGITSSFYQSGDLEDLGGGYADDDAAARRPLMPRGRSATRGSGRTSGGGERRRGVGRGLVDSGGGGGSLTASKMS